MNLYKWLVLKNIIAIICFTILAIVFNKWWIILFSILFLTTFKSKGGNNG
jgi:hypothetical protein